jgi:hypothetical protein
MPTSTYTKFHQFVEDLAHKIHDLETDSLRVALCAAANPPSASAHAVLANLTTVSLANLADASITIASSGQTSGTYTLTLTDKTLTASGGSVGPFRYVVVYNDTPTSPADPLLGYYDYGSDITLNAGESLLVDFAASTLTIT